MNEVRRHLPKHCFFHKEDIQPVFSLLTFITRKAPNLLSLPKQWGAADFSKAFLIGGQLLWNKIKLLQRRVGANVALIGT